MKFLFDFKENLGRGGIFKQTIRNESLHQDSNNNVVRIVNSNSNLKKSGC